MNKRRIGVAGCGFWANYQVAAWKEIDGVDIVAACDKNSERLAAFQKKFEIPQTFGDPEDMLRACKPDILEIISASDSPCIPRQTGSTVRRSGHLSETNDPHVGGVKGK
jgi:predicted dehydrogenase